MTSGRVINLHRFGATVRLEDGRLAVIPASEVAAHRASLESSLMRRRKLRFAVHESGLGLGATLAPDTFEEPVIPRSGDAPPLTDDAFEERLANYLRETEEWAPPDQPQPFERHLTRKKRRAAQFLTEESRQTYRGRG